MQETHLPLGLLSSEGNSSHQKAAVWRKSYRVDFLSSSCPWQAHLEVYKAYEVFKIWCAFRKWRVLYVLTQNQLSMFGSFWSNIACLEEKNKVYLCCWTGTVPVPAPLISFLHKDSNRAMFHLELQSLSFSSHFCTWHRAGAVWCLCIAQRPQLTTLHLSGLVFSRLYRASLGAQAVRGPGE